MTDFVLTEEEKVRWTPIIQRTWDAIAYDAIQVCGGRCSTSEAIEFATDADRPCDYGMTREEYRALCKMDHKVLNKWLRVILRGPHVI